MVKRPEVAPKIQLKLILEEAAGKILIRVKGERENV